MSHPRRVVAVVAALFLFPLPRALAQSSGSRGGVEESANAAPTTPDIPAPLDYKTAQRCIMVDGSAELRVRPTAIRVVFAVTHEGDVAAACRQNVEDTIAKLEKAWSKLGIAPEKMVVDFIAVLPVYEWKLEKRDDREVAVEKKVGYQVQANVHLAVETEAAAQAAVAKALEQGVTDIIAFDYWNRDLDEIKIKSRAAALGAARAKAVLLLKDLIESAPLVINVQEHTRVVYPESLYKSFTNSYDQDLSQSDFSRRDMPELHAYRPRNTYYRGLYHDGDIQGRELPMNPEISVISTVRLYLESPAAKNAREEAKAERAEARAERENAKATKATK